MTRTLRIELSPPLSPYCSGKGGGMCAVCGAVVKA